MYHTHVHDERQLPLGLYGPIIVVDGDEAFDPAIDHVLIVARSGLDPAAPNVLVPVTPVVLNGEPAPRFVWTGVRRHRLRPINITPDDILTVSLHSPQGAVAWTPMKGRRAAAPACAHRSPRCRRLPWGKPTISSWRRRPGHGISESKCAVRRGSGPPRAT